MLYNTLHHRWLRLVVALVGELIIAVSLNVFVVPLNMYSGGIMGVCQLIRTLLMDSLGISFGTHDIAGILYFLVNIPILLYAYKQLGKELVAKTLVCTVAYSFFYSLIPTPAQPIVSDYLTGCLLGGILTGVGGGLVLTCGCSSGGLDIIGLCLSKQGKGITVGRFSLFFNIFLYAACLLLFVPEVAIYSVIYNFFASIVMDRMHKQNINVQALIFTREDEGKLGRFIIEKLDRSVTYWTGTGAYSGKDVHVLCVCLSKYEIEELLHTVHTIDPNAFLTVQEGTRIYGNFVRKLD
ncbi:MAG: YitT family protein [Ruminococcaceae bacterium]|nr:YitT family protein [Oscillospiraceae bacterium]